MAVCHVGESWGVQSLCMGRVYLASLVQCTRHKRMLSTRHGTKTGAMSVPLTAFPSGSLPLQKRHEIDCIERQEYHTAPSVDHAPSRGKGAHHGHESHD